MGSENNSSSQAGFAAWLHSFPPGSQGNIILTWSGASILVAISLGVNFLTPILNAAILAPFFLAAIRKSDNQNALNFLLRWAAATFLVVTLACIFLPERSMRAIPFSEKTVAALTDWLNGTVPEAPFGPTFLLAGIAIMVGASLVTGGLGGLVLSSVAVCSSASAFAHLMRHGDNIIHLTFLGVPPWVITFLLSGILLLLPTASISTRWARLSAVLDSQKQRRLNMYTLAGLGLLLASIILSIVLGKTWGTVLRGCTVF